MVLVKYDSSISSLSETFSLRSKVFKSGFIVSIFSEVILEISLITISIPKSNFCSILRELFSK